MQEIFKKLDLVDYVESFTAFFARKKEVVLEGDINIHYKIIKELSTYEFKPPLEVQSLDKALMLIQKQAILKLDDIFEFIKIIHYFLYLKNAKFDGKLQEWFEKIIIPPEMIELTNYFNEKGS